MNKEEYQRLWEGNQALRDKVQSDTWRLGYHIMPESGWLNDPNGLCQFHGVYHIYYQYSPFDVEGKTKLWGHMTTRNFLELKQEEPVLFPDCRGDERGVYSGSAFLHNDELYMYYTGNVKLSDREDYDFIHAGREQNTILVKSKDGYTFDEKQWLMSNQDYPDDMSCHIRDPKIFEEENHYYMVLGARDTSDHGCILVYESEDLLNWNYHMRIEKPEGFGYMWECPDLFELDGKKFLVTCPQGVKPQGYDFANVHQCGYFPIDLQLRTKEYTLGAFHQLDRGFDFYAPQSFEDEKKRRILIGWMGLPDIEYTNPTTSYGWQHALTIPRELTQRDGILYQTPLKELEALRGKKYEVKGNELTCFYVDLAQFECEIRIEKQTSFVLQLRQGATFSYDAKTHVATLAFDTCGYGRDSRSLQLSKLEDLHIFADTSSFELFVNSGSDVFTSRVYTKQTECRFMLIDGELEGSLALYELNSCLIQ